MANVVKIAFPELQGEVTEVRETDSERKTECEGPRETSEKTTHDGIKSGQLTCPSSESHPTAPCACSLCLTLPVCLCLCLCLFPAQLSLA